MRYLLVLLVFTFASCSQESSDLPDDNLAGNDSLALRLNSPELRELNGRLLDDPGNADLYHQRARVYFGLKELTPAENDAKRAIRLDSTRADYYLTLVDVYFSQNSTRMAKELLEIIEKKFPSNTEALLKLAELYWLVRQYQKGLDYVNKALKIDMHLARGYYIKGGIYRESGDTARAVSSLETATEQDNRYKDAFYDLGVIYAARKNPVAIQYFDNVIRIDPSHLEARYGRSKVLQDIGKTDEAIAGYEELIALNPGCGQCHYNIGAMMLEIRKDNRQALSHFTEAIKIDPAFAQAYFARGYTYTKLKDFESAKADYKMCLQLSPGFEPAVEGLNAIE